MSHKIFDYDLVTIPTKKVIFTLNKPGYIRMRILEVSKVLMYKFQKINLKIKIDNKIEK